MTSRSRTCVLQALIGLVIGVAASVTGHLAAADKLVSPFTEKEAIAAKAAWAKQLNVETIKENKLGMKLTLIPPGEFQMGSPVNEFLRLSGESPHRVRITQPFFLGVYEVTQREWADVMGSQPSYFSANGKGKERVNDQDTSRFPVEQVSWEEATEFCRKLGLREGKTYRLPTEAEWEYACRAGTTSPFHFGRVLNGDKANVDGDFPYGTTTMGKDLNRTAQVGSYEPNAFGLYDMHGNVWEWCRDWHDDDFPSRAAVDDPENTTDSKFRVLRGGSWDLFASLSRSAVRLRLPPVKRDINCGFRVVCTLP